MVVSNKTTNAKKSINEEEEEEENRDLVLFQLLLPSFSTPKIHPHLAVELAYF